MNNSVNSQTINGSNKNETNYKKIVSELKKLITIFYNYDDSSMIFLKNFMNDVSKLYNLFEKKEITEQKYNELRINILKNTQTIKLRFNKLENMLSVIINAINQDFIEVEENYKRLLKSINGTSIFNIEESNDSLLILRSFIKEGIFLKTINEDLKKIFSNFLKEILMLEQVLININNFNLINEETSPLRIELINRLYNLIDWYTYFIDKIVLILRDSNIKLEELKNQSEELARESTEIHKIRDYIIAKSYLMKGFFEKRNQYKLAFKIVNKLLYPFPKENIGGETDSWVLFRDNAMNYPVSQFLLAELKNENLIDKVISFFGYKKFIIKVYNHQGINALTAYQELKKEQTKDYVYQISKIKYYFQQKINNETKLKIFFVDYNIISKKKNYLYKKLAELNNTNLFTTLRSLFKDDKTLQLRPSEPNVRFGLDKIKTLAYATKSFAAKKILNEQGISIDHDLSLKERYEMMFGNLIINGKRTKNELEPYFKFFADYLGVLISDISESDLYTYVIDKKTNQKKLKGGIIFIGSYLKDSPYWSVAISKINIFNRDFYSIAIRYQTNEEKLNDLYNWFKSLGLSDDERNLYVF
ncbi:MAG: hypothetical protein QXR96_01095 [Candidatus Woesearchaeota archaeon]